MRFGLEAATEYTPKFGRIVHLLLKLTPGGISVSHESPSIHVVQGILYCRHYQQPVKSQRETIVTS